MDFIKKNYGFLLFLIACLGVVIYQVIGIVGAQGLREKNKQLRQEHLDRLKSVRSANRRIDTDNLEKAEKVAEAAKEQYLSFAKSLWEKQLLPGVDMTIDLDEAAAEPAAPAEPELDEDGNPIPAQPKVDPYKEHPNRKLYDEWMKGSLVDARETLTNELIRINSRYFKFDAEDDDDDDDDVSMQAMSKAEKEKAEKERAEKKAAVEKKEEEEKKAAKEAGKSTYEFEKEKRSKIIKGMSVPEYFMFGEYVLERESGLRNLKEKRGVFRQLLLLQALVRYLQRAEITELDDIDFPCGLEIMDGDKYTSTPVTLSMTAKPECIEAFLNLLNANEDYVFYLRDIVSFDAEVQLNDDPMLAFNSGATSASALLDNYLKSAAATTGEGGMGDGMGGGRRRRGAMPDDGMGMDGGRRGRRVDPAMGMDGGMGMDGMGGPLAQQPLPKTRKAYRVFAKAQEEKNSGMEGGMGMGMGNSMGVEQKRESSSAELGTSVSVKINFELVEFKPVGE